MERFGYQHYAERILAGDVGKRHRQEELVSFFSGCKSVLDLGCGSGVFLQLLQERGIHAEGVDLVIDQASLENQGVSIHCSDVLDYVNQCHEAYDGALCSHLIEHLQFDDVLDLLEGVWRCLVPGGVFVLVFPNPQNLLTHTDYFWIDFQHVRPYHPRLVEAVLKHYRFDLIYSNAPSREELNRAGCIEGGKRMTVLGKLKRLAQRKLGILQLEERLRFLEQRFVYGPPLNAVVVAKKQRP